MNRRRQLLLIAGVAALLGGAWWLFGWSTFRRGDDHITLRRSFGRVTRIDAVMLVKGVRVRERSLFDWSHPFVNGFASTDCGAIFPETWQDRNGDGRWDTWLYRVGPDSTGHCQSEYRVDTRGAGIPDWMFTMPYGQREKAEAMIKERRGY